MFKEKFPRAIRQPGRAVTPVAWEIECACRAQGGSRAQKGLPSNTVLRLEYVPGHGGLSQGNRRSVSAEHSYGQIKYSVICFSVDFSSKELNAFALISFLLG